MKDPFAEAKSRKRVNDRLIREMSVEEYKREVARACQKEEKNGWCFRKTNNYAMTTIFIMCTCISREKRVET